MGIEISDGVGRPRPDPAWGQWKGNNIMPMEYGTIEGMDKKISRILQGTMMLREDDLQESFDLLDGVWALGVNGFDGAYIYGGGQCERVLGQWLDERGLFEEAVILTKGRTPHWEEK